MTQANATRPDGSEFSAELGQVPERAKPRAWAIFLDDGNARMWGTLQPHVQKLADAEGLTITPLYDQAALDAAVEQAKARQNAAWRLMCDKMVAAESERLRKELAEAQQLAGWWKGMAEIADRAADRARRRAARVA